MIGKKKKHINVDTVCLRVIQCNLWSTVFTNAPCCATYLYILPYTHYQPLASIWPIFALLFYFFVSLSRFRYMDFDFNAVTRLHPVSINVSATNITNTWSMYTYKYLRNIESTLWRPSLRSSFILSFTLYSTLNSCGVENWEMWIRCPILLHTAKKIEKKRKLITKMETFVAFYLFVFVFFVFLWNQPSGFIRIRCREKKN